MIKLLENEFKQHYGIVRPLHVSYNRYKDDFVLTDEKACKQCAQNGHNSDCQEQEVVRFICKDKEAIVIDFEGFINSLSGTEVGKGRKCDIVLYTLDKDKFILNELTCSRADYILPYKSQGKDKPGKRATAVNQINDTIKRLEEVKKIDSFINSFNERIGLFACRVKNPSNQSMTHNVAIQGMQQFMRPSHNIASLKVDNLLNHGFTFIQLVYPQAFIL